MSSSSSSFSKPKGVTRSKTAPSHPPASRKGKGKTEIDDKISKAVDIALSNSGDDLDVVGSSNPASFEISEIDRRLNALQGFLKDAKRKKTNDND